MGNADDVVRLAGILGCGVVSLQLKYFGLPLGNPIRPSIYGVVL